MQFKAEILVWDIETVQMSLNMSWKILKEHKGTINVILPTQTWASVWLILSKLIKVNNVKQRKGKTLPNMFYSW